MPENASGFLPTDVLRNIAEYQHSNLEPGTRWAALPNEVIYCTQCCTHIANVFLSSGRSTAQFYYIPELRHSVYFRDATFCRDCEPRISLALRFRSATVDWCYRCMYHRILIYVPSREEWCCEYCDWWDGRRMVRLVEVFQGTH